MLAALALTIAAAQLQDARPASAFCAGGHCMTERWPRSPLTVSFRAGHDRLDDHDLNLLETFSAQYPEFAAWHIYVCVPASDPRRTARTRFLLRGLTRGGFRDATVTAKA